jgi:CHASE3 domain sensor protein
MDWASEKLAKDLVKYVDAFNDDPVSTIVRRGSGARTMEQDIRAGLSEWKNNKSEKVRRQQRLAGT